MKLCLEAEGKTSGVIPHAKLELFKKEKANSTISAEMLALANAVTDSNAVLFDGANGFAGCIPGLHYVLKKQGLMKTLHCINPNEVLSAGQDEELERIYGNCNSFRKSL